MATVNRRTTHDSVRLEITWDTIIQLHLTWDRAGERITHTQRVEHEIAAKILQHAHPAPNDTIGEWVEKIWVCAAGTRDPIELLKLLRAFPKPGEPKLIEHQSRRVKFKPR